jgi:dTDP-4-amino-4,6-dideoxygalactose transaminase
VIGVRVPFLDLRAAYDELRDEIDAAVTAVARSGWYLLGEQAEAFEAEFAAYAGARHCATVGSGLDALTLGLRALGIGAGDEVLVPSVTFVATWLAVSAVGATPVPVEPDPQTYCIDAAGVAAALTPRTRAVIPVHLYGHPADIDGIRDVAAKHGLAVLDDAAQAHGARLRGRRIGGLAHLTAWSFYPAKNLGAMGDGGALTGDDPELLDRVRRLRNYGSTVKYVHDERGVNSRLDEMQCAVLRVKLRHLDDWNARRAAIAALYTRELRDTPVTTPAPAAHAEPVWHLYVVRTAHRDALREHLRGAGVDALVHYPVAPHLQAAYADLGLGPGSLPISEAVHREVLSLPIGPHLATDQAMAVVEAIRRFRP